MSILQAFALGVKLFFAWLGFWLAHGLAWCLAVYAIMTAFINIWPIAFMIMHLQTGEWNFSVTKYARCLSFEYCVVKLWQWPLVDPLIGRKPWATIK